MQDTIKVFVDVPRFDGYVESQNMPFEAQFVFHSTLNFYVVKNDVITNEGIPWQYNAVPGISPGVVYATLYQDILTHATLSGFPTPGQKDIFCWIPTALSQIFVDIPAIS